MNVTTISFKECWQEPGGGAEGGGAEGGGWYSTGGFPRQMAAIASLFDRMTLLVVPGRPRPGGLPLPEAAHVIPLPAPADVLPGLLSRGLGRDARRKLAVLLRAPVYAGRIARASWAADVVHIPLPGDIPLIGLLVAALLGKRLIARYGGAWEETAQTTPMNRFTKACMRWLRREPFAGQRRVMFATGAAASLTGAACQPMDGGLNLNEVIQEGSIPAPGIHWLFSTALSQAELQAIHPRVEHGLSRPPRLAYVGRLSPEKGVQHLIEALACLQESGFQPLPELEIIGDGPQGSALQALAREHGLCVEDGAAAASLIDGSQAGGKIFFTGQLDRQALFQRLSQVDFCIQPSLTEALSKAWLDAMAHGLPVLTSDVGAAAPYIGRRGERGWLVPPGDVPALANRLREILGQGHPIDWPALRRRCRLFVEGLTLEAWAQQIGAICAQQWGISFSGGKLGANHEHTALPNKARADAQPHKRSDRSDRSDSKRSDSDRRRR